MHDMHSRVLDLRVVPGSVYSLYLSFYASCASFYASCASFCAVHVRYVYLTVPRRVFYDYGVLGPNSVVLSDSGTV